MSDTQLQEFFDAADYEELVRLNKEIMSREKRNMIDHWYPEETHEFLGKQYFAKELYPKLVQFWEAGNTYTYRFLDAANQVGKTSGVAYEVSLHLTGLYPDDWTGKRLSGPNRWWIAGESWKDVREIMQERLIGQVGELGSGLIRYDCLDLESMTKTDRVETLVPSFRVRHFDADGNFDGYSHVTFKSYEAGRESFQGLPRNIWLDEEPDLQIYEECVARTTSDPNLMLIMTFTPNKGVTDTFLNFCPGGWPGPGYCGPIMHNGKNTGRWFTNITAYEVPHITKEKLELLENQYHPHVREARLLGKPNIGSGAIYPDDPKTYTVQYMEIPKNWKRCFALDVGWNWTAAVWLAIDPQTGIRYIYDSYKQGETEPVGHAKIMRDHGIWIPGAIDPAANGRGQSGSEALMQQYRDLGLELTNAVNEVQAGLNEVWMGIRSGYIKVMNCPNNQPLFSEMANYRRDEKGRIIKENDHLVDALRYAIMTEKVKGIAITEPGPKIQSTGSYIHRKY